MTAVEMLRAEAAKRGMLPHPPLWPAPYNELTAESAYRFLTECILTFDESCGEDRQVPELEYLRMLCEEWHSARKEGRTVHIIKSRRLIVSWGLGAIELHEAGIKRGVYMIAAESFEGENGACAFVHRQKYLYDQLAKRFPKWGLPEITATGGKGSAESKEVLLANGSRFVAGNSDPGKFQGGGKGYIRLEELSQYQEVERIRAQAGINTQGSAENVGGMVLSVSNATANPEFLEVMQPHNGERLLEYGVARARDNVFGHRVIEIHYAADPAKQREWAENTRRANDIPIRQWLREYEGEINAFEGEPVWPEYRPEVHKHDGFIPLPSPSQCGWLIGGWDCGAQTENPRFVFGHVLPYPNQQIQLLLEVDPGGPCSMETFCGLVEEKLSKHYPDWRSYQIDHQADPAGNNLHKTGQSAFQIAAKKGFHLKPSSNNLSERIGDVAWAFGGWIIEDEQPRIVISAPGCPSLIGAVSGGYAYRVDGGAGNYRVVREPRKDGWSHVADAFQYLVMRARKLIQVGQQKKTMQRGINRRGSRA